MKKAYALATILVLLGVTLFGMAAVVTVSTLESRISRSQQEGVRAYYTAEAGIKDAMWRLNTNATYSAAVAAGNLNVSYTTTDVPASGLGYCVNMVTDASHGAGYATVTVTGTSNNGFFTAQRKIIANVFQGVNSATNGNALYSGGAFKATNSNSQIHIIGGDLYATQSITINNSPIDLGDSWINSVGAYNVNNSQVTTAGIHASNYAPAASNIASPGIDFTYYSTHYNKRYTSAQFQALFNNKSSVTLAGPVTYVDGSLAITNWMANKTLIVNGMLIVNGDFTVNGSASGSTFAINDPGSGKSGLFVRTNMSISNGVWTVDGTLFASGSTSLTNSQTMTINGAFISGGDVQFNCALPLTLTYIESRVTASFGSGTPMNVEVQHWEEDY